MRNTKLILAIVLLIALISLNTLNSSIVHAASNDSRSHLHPLDPSSVPCLPQYNKVALEEFGGNWFCYGNSPGTVSGFSAFYAVNLHSDDWSGRIYSTEGLSWPFCNHSQIYIGSYISSLYLSPTNLC